MTFRDKPTLTVDRKYAKTFKVKAWSHQDELKSLIGKRITLVYTNDVEVTAELLSADAFTLRVRIDKTGVTSTIFKHYLAAYSERRA